jgi:heme O synthase-like polyprenyltransferase
MNTLIEIVTKSVVAFIFFIPAILIVQDMNWSQRWFSFSICYFWALICFFLTHKIAQQFKK